MEQSPFWAANPFFQIAKKFPSFYEIRKIITAFTRARHLSLSWANSIQSILISPHPTSWRYILILSPIYTWAFQVVSFPQVSPPKPYIHLSSPHTCYMFRPSHYSRFLSSEQYWVRSGEIIHLLITLFSPLPCCVYYVCNNYPPVACMNFSSPPYMPHGPSVTFSVT